jgi:hypothetical protein
VEVERLPRGERRREPKTLWLWWDGPGKEQPALDLLWRAYIRRFDLEHTFRFLKQTLGWTIPRVRHPEQADRWTWLVVAVFHPTQAGAVGRCGPEAALGETLRQRPSDTGAGPPHGFSAFSRSRHTRQATKTLRTLTGTAQRAPLWPSQALPGRQEGCLNTHEDSERGSFARDTKPIAKLSCLKRKLRASANRRATFRT